MKGNLCGVNLCVVCLSRSCILSKQINVSSILFQHRVAILVFPQQMVMKYSEGNPANGSVECRWGRLNLRFPVK